LGEEALKYVINETEVKIIITSQELIPKIEVKTNFQKQKDVDIFFWLFRKYIIKQKKFVILYIYLLWLSRKKLKYQKIKIILNLFN